VPGPDLTCWAPCGTGHDREQTAAYGQAAAPVRSGSRPLYSIDENLWGRAIECGALRTHAEAPEDVWERTVDPSKAPSDPDYLEIAFAQGVPTGVDGEALGFAENRPPPRPAGGSFRRRSARHDRRPRGGHQVREVYEVPRRRC